jgi:hypothetical protein
MKTKNTKKILSIILIYSVVFTATASAYTLSGQITNNSIGIYSAQINFDINNTYSNSTGYYTMSNLSGNIIINFSKNPEYYQNSTSANMDSNKTLNVNLLKKPTGTITGCVFVFGGINPCEITQNIIVSSNRIRWWF